MKEVVLVRKKQSRKKGSTLTLVHRSHILERAQKQHKDDSHTEDLNAAPRHIQHERLHWEALCWRYCEIPGAFVLELILLVFGCAGWSCST